MILRCIPISEMLICLNKKAYILELRKCTWFLFIFLLKFIFSVFFFKATPIPVFLIIPNELQPGGPIVGTVKLVLYNYFFQVISKYKNLKP